MNFRTEKEREELRIDRWLFKLFGYYRNYLSSVLIGYGFEITLS